MTNKTQLDYLSNEWGFNVVRLGGKYSNMIPSLYNLFNLIL